MRQTAPCRDGTEARQRGAGYASQQRTPRAATKGNRAGRGEGSSRTDTAVDGSKNEVVDRVARFRFD